MERNDFLLNKEIYQSNMKIEDKIILFLFGIYFVLKPFYFWSSGLPQISDLLIIFTIFFFTVIKKKFFFISTNNQIIMYGSLFVYYSVIINLIWSLILSTEQMISPSFYLIYNFIIFLFTSSLMILYRDKMLKVTFISILFSVLLQFLVFISNGGFIGVRNTGSFNNPNQLGYYGLLVISIIAIISTKIKVSFKLIILGISAAFILIFSSLSKAAILSGVGLLIIYFFISLKDNKHRKKALSVILILFFSINFISQTTDFFETNPMWEAVQSRLDRIGQDSDDSIEGRGYDRIINYPEYWVFGAGEGEFNRFSGWLQGAEFHSTLGNIQVSYGLVGLILFTLFLYQILKRDIYRNWYIIFFILIYGVTHNGLRNTFFWILFAIMIN